MPDLISRLSEKLDEAERVALSAQAGRWVTHGECVIVDDGNPDTPLVARMSSRGNRDHMAFWDPQSVLRLVAAHREVIKLHTPRPRDERNAQCPECVYDDLGVHGLDRALFPCDTLKLIAAGWGVTDGDG